MGFKQKWTVCGTSNPELFTDNLIWNWSILAKIISFWEPRSGAVYWWFDLKLIHFSKNQLFLGPQSGAVYWWFDLKLVYFWSNIAKTWSLRQNTGKGGCIKFRVPRPRATHFHSFEIQTYTSTLYILFIHFFNYNFGSEGADFLLSGFALDCVLKAPFWQTVSSVTRLQLAWDSDWQ